MDDDGFNFKSKKRARNKESAMLGIFGDDDDDEADSRPSFGGGGRRGGRRGGGGGGRDPTDDMDVSTPVSFVASGSLIPGQKDEEDRMDTDDTAPPPAKKPKKDKKESEKPNNKKKGFVPQEPSVGEFEVHTKGIGAKLLKMMGWKEGQGLGKDGSGIAKPIEVVQRRKGQALQDEEFKGSTLNRWGSESSSESEESDSEDKNDSDKFSFEKKPKRKTKYIYDDEPRPSAPTQLIVDMRGPQARVLTSMDGVTGGSAAATEDEVKYARYHTLDVRKRHEQQVLDTLLREEASLTKQIDISEDNVNRLQDLLEIIESTKAKLLTNDSSLTLEFLAKLFDLIQTKYDHEYRVFKLESLAYHFVFPLIQRKFKDWNPLANPEYGVTMVETWHSILTEGEEEMRDPDDDRLDDPFGVTKAKGMSGGEAVFHHLIADLVLPKFRQAVTNDWDTTKPQPCIALISNWAAALPVDVVENIMTGIILPRLRKAVDSWDPRKEPVPVHAWIHPWLPILKHRLDSLFEVILRKLLIALQQWQCTDPSAILLLQPWKAVFTMAEWERLLLRAILPKLVEGLRSFQIDPSKQDLTLWKAVVAWADLIPAEHMATLFETEFFPKFFQVLQYWLSTTTNYEEVSRWYMFWKQQIPASLVQFDRIKAQLSQALKIMNAAVSGGSAEAGKPTASYLPSYGEPPARSAPLPRFMPLYSESAVAKKAKAQAALEASQRKPYIPTPSFRDLIEQTAEKNELLMIKTTKTHETKQVYMFGNVPIYLDREVVYTSAGADTPNTWKPVSLDELVELTKETAPK